MTSDDVFREIVANSTKFRLATVQQGGREYRFSAESGCDIEISRVDSGLMKIIQTEKSMVCRHAKLIKVLGYVTGDSVIVLGWEHG